MRQGMLGRRGRWVGVLVGMVVFALAGLLVGAVDARASGAAKRGPITITGDGGFAGCGCVVSGSGTAASPFVIGPWTINNVNGPAVSVSGTTKAFVLKNLTIAGNASPLDVGIDLNAVQNAQVSGSQTSIQKNDVGIRVENSTNVVLDGGGANPNGAGAGPVAGTINKNMNGAIDVENSSGVTVRGWQMSANGRDNLDPNLWLTLDPSLWGVGAVRFFGVTYSKIDHNAANNDTDVSYSLFDSGSSPLDGNTISNNTANYPLTSNVMLSDGSSYNTISGNQFSTADFVGILIADPLRANQPPGYAASHDNVVTNNFDHTDGPTGNELAAGQAPAFEGGIVILNGTYNNQIISNQATASAGADLVWAQEVPTQTPRSRSTPPHRRRAIPATSPNPKAAAAPPTRTATSGATTPSRRPTPAPSPRNSSQMTGACRAPQG
jgi:hypothetical protein